MSRMKLTAWTDDPGRIPRTKTLLIAEHEQQVTYDDPDMQRIFGNLPPYLRQKKTLSYRVIIHLRNVADFRSRSPSPSPGPSPPSSDGDSGHDGNPDRGYGESRGVGPRLHGFPIREGVVDGASDSPPDETASGSQLRHVGSQPPPVHSAPQAVVTNLAAKSNTPSSTAPAMAMAVTPTAPAMALANGPGSTSPTAERTPPVNDRSPSVRARITNSFRTTFLGSASLRRLPKVKRKFHERVASATIIAGALVPSLSASATRRLTQAGAIKSCAFHSTPEIQSKFSSIGIKALFLHSEIS